MNRELYITEYFMKSLVAAHLATVVPAFLIGTWLIFFSTKGARRHRALGAAYLALMLATAILTFFIRELKHGALSWIHYMFIPLTLFGIWSAISGVRARNIARHRNAMIGLYAGVVGAGVAAMLPGRFLSTILW